MSSEFQYTLVSPTYFSISRINMTVSHEYDCRLGLNHVSLCCVTKGRLSIEAGGRTIRAQAGDAVYFPKRRRYYSHWTGDPDIEFVALYLDFQRRAIGPQSVHQLHEAPDPFYFQTLPREEADYPALFNAIYDDYYSAPNNLLALSGCYSLYDHMIRRMTPEPAQLKLDSMEAAIHFLDACCTQSLTIEDVARHCGMSESQLYHRFREATGHSPIEYRNRERIRRAIELLSDDSLSVEYIAERLGFSSPTYFRRIFKKYTGGSPSDYRGRIML